MFWKNWKTVDNNPNYHTESDSPILKKDEHHAEIIDISDGLVIEEISSIMIDYNSDDHEVLKKNDVWDAFGNSKI